MALAAKLYFAENAGERRAAPRRRIGHGTTLRLSGLPVDVLLHDLSETGALIETAAPLMDGATVTIGLAGVGRFEARVVSRKNSRYGCRFVMPLSAEAAASAFRADAVVAGPFAVATGPHFEMADHGIARWPGVIRVALPTGMAIGGWGVMIGFVRRAIGW